MALRLQMEKKKAQEEMRRLMAERKKKDVKPVKIDHPLARYNNAGQITCLLCTSVVRSENVWQIHLNSKQHRENVDKAKKLKELTNNFTVAKVKHKSCSPPRDAPPVKKIKGILKNAGPPLAVMIQKPKNDAPNIVSFHDEEIKRGPITIPLDQSKSEKDNEELPTTSESEKEQPVSEVPIPEGFFDDPILDAKVRKIEYKDPIEEEWEKFRKEIKEETSASAEIIAGEQEEATAERQIDEIDEQIRKWSRVLDLELKKEETKKKIQESEQMSLDENGESEDEDEIDEFLDWRSKKSFT